MEQSDGSAYGTRNAFRQFHLSFRRSRRGVGEVLERACNFLQSSGLRVFLVWVHMDRELFS